MILWSNSARSLSTPRRCLTSQYSRTSGAVRLHVLGNPLCLVLMSLMYCKSLCPAARMRSGEVRAVLLFAPNVAMVVVDATQSSMSSDSVTSDCVGLAGNTSSSDFNTLVGLRETASEALCHFPGQCWIVNLYLSVFFFQPEQIWDFEFCSGPYPQIVLLGIHGLWPLRIPSSSDFFMSSLVLTSLQRCSRCILVSPAD